MAFAVRHACAAVGAVAAVAESKRRESGWRGFTGRQLHHPQHGSQLHPPRRGLQLLRCEVSNEFHFSRGDLILKRGTDLRSEYTIEEEVGAGGFGTVCIGVHKRTGTKWAIKAIPKNQTSKSQFDEEVSALANLDHPHIIRLVEVFEDAKSFYLVQELCTGPDLIDFVGRKGRISEVDVSIIMRQCLKSVLGCHAHGFVHRDIKLDNFMITGTDATVKMIDFGLAARVCAGGSFTEQAGTVEYYAPEMVDDSAKGYDALIDVWSLGVVMYALLTGWMLLESDLVSFVVGGSYEVRDCNGVWWPMTLHAINEKDGTYIVDVKDEHKTRLTVERASVRTDEAEEIKALLKTPHYVEERLKTKKIKCEDARDLLSRMLHHNPKERIKPTDALNHPFIVRHFFKGLSGSHKADLPTSFDKSILDKMRQFGQRPRLTQIARQAMVHLTSEEEFVKELLMIRHMFRTVDIDGDGEVTYQEFTQFLQNYHIDIPSDFEKVYRACDSNGNGTLNFVEFVAALIPASVIDRRLCIEVFRLLEREKKGKLAARDLQRLLQTSNKTSSDFEEIIDEAERTIRAPGDAVKGSLDFDDFQLLLRDGLVTAE